VEITVLQRIEQTRSVCEHALSDPRLMAAENLLAAQGVTEQMRLDILRGVARIHKPTAELLSLRESVLLQGGLAAEPHVLERALLLRVALGSLDRIPQLPVEDSVKHLFCKEFMFYANPPEKDLHKFVHMCHPFLTMVKLALLIRFPAGLMQWEVSGLPRRWLLDLPPTQMPRTLYFLAMKARAFHPYFEPHITVSSLTVRFLSEREFLKSFYRMAASLEKQPTIRGILEASWLHSSETHRVSPHLAFMNHPYLESGGLCADLGPAAADSGFLAGDKNRWNLYKSGQYKPKNALVICTREQALAWKSKHSRLEGKLGIGECPNVRGQEQGPS
jgi:hypothetical protein